ncbi:MAG TPA: hypothetical protein EYP68_07980 [Candidatus Korarchaeota archaeon]|nr:hypothetical protein [Candidatus Korarchaeota archaeon]
MRSLQDPLLGLLGGNVLDHFDPFSLEKEYDAKKSIGKEQEFNTLLSVNGTVRVRGHHKL